MFSFPCFAGIFLFFICVQEVESQVFGDDIDSVGFGGDVVSKNEDHRFSDMGQVTKETFDVAGGTVSLTLNVEDTVGIKEIWILDFQQYRYDLDNLPVDEATGRLIAGNTSPCSSVFEDQDFDVYLADDYFQDLNSSTGLTGKDLFTHFERGTVVDNRRSNKIHFTGPMATWFDCTESDLTTKVWQLTSDASDADEIEYRTKIYAINVRPKDEANPLGGISFVQSHIELIWRLSRTALSTVIISSTALLQPILEFARVSAVFDSQGDPVPTQAHLHLKFRTAVDSGEQMVTYIADSIAYTPDDDALAHGLRYTILTPDTTVLGGPQCTFQLDEGTSSQSQCNQVWEFKLVLDIDIAGHEDNRAPIDASGTFEFSFRQYTCVSLSNVFDPNSCTLLSEDPAKVAALITIQTTVFVQDEEDDQVAILLVALKGADNQELSVAGSRGIAHKENVTLEVKFSPALLRENYKLDLLLFMVCRGDQYISDEYPHGCLQAESLDRYVAHRTESFSYTPRHHNASGTFEGTPYEYDSISSDYFQGLEYEGYEENDEFGRPLPVPVHRSTFTNIALSGDHAKYVITTVYRLTDKNGRKRRGPSRYSEVVISKMTLDDALSYFHGKPVFQRYRRDIEDSANEDHSQRYAYTSLGCPEDALHKDMDCHCPAGTEYSTYSFQCEMDNSVIEEIDKVDDILDNLEEKTNVIDSGADGLTSCVMPLFLVMCIGFQISSV